MRHPEEYRPSGFGVKAIPSCALRKLDDLLGHAAAGRFSLALRTRSRQLDADLQALATDETQSSAQRPNSRLLSAEGPLCSHTEYVRELAN